ncbi:MAG: hypothetical protein JXQ93_01945 [Flavobacteriaceae bacterium]
MKIKNILFITILLSCSNLFSQRNYSESFSKTNKDLNLNKIDSIAKKLGYKGGDSFRVIVNFAVNWKGEIVDITAKGPHKIFEDEAIRVVKLIPKFEALKNLKEGEKERFTLPMKIMIETESEKRKRIKKEKRKKRKEAKRNKKN